MFLSIVFRLIHCRDGQGMMGNKDAGRLGHNTKGVLFAMLTMRRRANSEGYSVEALAMIQAWKQRPANAAHCLYLTKLVNYWPGWML